MGCGASASSAHSGERSVASSREDAYDGSAAGIGSDVASKKNSLMRQPTYGSQSKFRFNLRTDHKIRDIARFYHELPQTLMWVDHKSSGDNKVLHPTAFHIMATHCTACVLPFVTVGNT